jgi:hypothetical protein
MSEPQTFRIGPAGNDPKAVEAAVAAWERALRDEELSRSRLLCARLEGRPGEELRPLAMDHWRALCKLRQAESDLGHLFTSMRFFAIPGGDP